MGLGIYKRKTKFIRIYKLTYLRTFVSLSDCHDFTQKQTAIKVPPITNQRPILEVLVRGSNQGIQTEGYIYLDIFQLLFFQD